MKKRILRNLIIISCLSALALALTFGSAQAQTPGLKINQVYGGAGMDALGYKYDYVELINTSNVTVAYANIYIFVGKYNNLSPTTVSLGPVSVPARSYYLIRFAGSPSNLGSDLTTQDADAGNVVLPGGNSGDAAVGVVMLYSVNPNSPTSCNVTTGLLDKLSYGGFIWTNCYEGTQSALYTDGTHALQRKVVNGNAQDTDNNSNDFILVAPTPRNSGSVPLPVQMVNVAAVYTSDRDVKISWSTISEIDNYGFTVERRSGNDATFVTLPGSFQSGHGTTLTDVPVHIHRCFCTRRSRLSIPYQANRPERPGALQRSRQCDGWYNGSERAERCTERVCPEAELPQPVQPVYDDRVHRGTVGNNEAARIQSTRAGSREALR